MKQREELNEREKRFVAAFIKEPNGTRAAISAGYSARTATAQASRLLTRGNVKTGIEKWRAEVTERTKIDAEYVLSRAVELHDAAIRKGDYHAAARALEIIGKHRAVKAFDQPKPGYSGAHLHFSMQQFIFDAVKRGKEEKRLEALADARAVD
jgi:phage terminase small subunit